MRIVVSLLTRLSSFSNDRISNRHLVQKLVMYLRLKDEAALLEWHDGPEIHPFWARIADDFLSHRAHNLDIPDQTKFLKAFKKATNDESILVKFRLDSFDTKDCTQIDRMVKFATDIVDYACENFGVLTRVMPDTCLNCLGTVIYMNIDLLSRVEDADRDWSLENDGNGFAS
ncbi:hypothetical protein J7T55_011336 [Diaporthe amygdali]|uniref:uncharacterized protein n=1 Tax=Phomopsis amygdali TaxID=1214568 RepID=UPI0022FF0091|nr:uncharacterized protein J7T55_011336 [Diaporthe amygdali]KAJ0108845.1 hypothetical protein J7T55_011336 [Diaporthe amygdali]